MKIDNTRLNALHANSAELRDGLFSVVAQTRLIEMHYILSADDQESWVVRTSELPADKDGICNSSFTAGENSFYEDFMVNVEIYEFKTREEAMQFYFGYITQHNHF